jgi:hypothetical protein
MEVLGDCSAQTGTHFSSATSQNEGIKELGVLQETLGEESRVREESNQGLHRPWILVQEFIHRSPRTNSRDEALDARKRFIGIT